MDLIQTRPSSKPLPLATTISLYSTHHCQPSTPPTTIYVSLATTLASPLLQPSTLATLSPLDLKINHHLPSDHQSANLHRQQPPNPLAPYAVPYPWLTSIQNLTIWLPCIKESEWNENGSPTNYINKITINSNAVMNEDNCGFSL